MAWQEDVLTPYLPVDFAWLRNYSKHFPREQNSSEGWQTFPSWFTFEAFALRGEKCDHVSSVRSKRLQLRLLCVLVLCSHITADCHMRVATSS
eukprot:5598737-Amphidinium_carterae.1